MKHCFASLASRRSCCLLDYRNIICCFSKTISTDCVENNILSPDIYSHCSFFKRFHNVLQSTPTLLRATSSVTLTSSLDVATFSSTACLWVSCNSLWNGVPSWAPSIIPLTGSEGAYGANLSPPLGSVFQVLNNLLRVLASLKWISPHFRVVASPCFTHFTFPLNNCTMVTMWHSIPAALHPPLPMP